MDDLIDATVQSVTQTSPAPAEDSVGKLIEAVNHREEESVEDDLREALKGLNLGEFEGLLGDINEAEMEELMSQAQSLLGGDSSDKEKLNAEILQLLGEEEGGSEEDRAILKEVQSMVADLETGKTDEASVVARAFDLITKLRSVE